DLQNEELLKELLDTLEINLDPKNEGFVYVNGEDVTEQIRSTHVTANVSIIASYEKVRLEMVERQRQLARNGKVVLDGRDIGTSVLPNANLKVFLFASVEERARRRYEEEVAKG